MKGFSSFEKNINYAVKQYSYEKTNFLLVNLRIGYCIGKSQEYNNLCSCAFCLLEAMAEILNKVTGW